MNASTPPFVIRMLFVQTTSDLTHVPATRAFTALAPLALTTMSALVKEQAITATIMPTVPTRRDPSIAPVMLGSMGMELPALITTNALVKMAEIIATMPQVSVLTPLGLTRVLVMLAILGTV